MSMMIMAFGQAANQNFRCQLNLKTLKLRSIACKDLKRIRPKGYMSALPVVLVLETRNLKKPSFLVQLLH